MNQVYFLEKAQKKIIYVNEIITLYGNINAILIGFAIEVSDLTLNDIKTSVGDGYNVSKVVAGKKSLVLITTK